jgi:plasmid stabilization system protein ParE
VSYRIVIRPEAEEEVAEAARWYEARERGLGREFLRAFRAVTATLRRNPLLNQVVVGQARRALFRRFPYGVIYEVHGQDVVVLACFHHARDPQEWQRRIGRS